MAKPYNYHITFQRTGLKRDGTKHLCKMCVEDIEPGRFQIIWHGINVAKGTRWVSRFHELCFPKFMFMRAEERENTIGKRHKPQASIKPLSIEERRAISASKIWENPDDAVRARRRTLMLYMNRDLRLYERNGKLKKLNDLAIRFEEFDTIGYFKDIGVILERTFKALIPEFREQLDGVTKDNEGKIDLGAFVEWYIQTFRIREELVQEPPSNTARVVKGNRPRKTDPVRDDEAGTKPGKLPRQHAGTKKQRTDLV